MYKYMTVECQSLSYNVEKGTIVAYSKRQLVNYQRLQKKIAECLENGGLSLLARWWTYTYLVVLCEGSGDACWLTIGHVVILNGLCLPYLSGIVTLVYMGSKFTSKD